MWQILLNIALTQWMSSAVSDLLAESFSSDAGLKIKITIWCGQR
ncbi:hypothetical protein ymoll0001_23240 [Yersinia mollaretii ATCC 43969]|uniref:Uncharacterized protein n=1 Tax=Yersinia mollaretii (strain ATCC 43969 / DSM 18520 / CIP 103324 / CNY 7263 / WAIP 204) TaxID=349967 RepID=A0ABM9YDD3_YERMW|nr:hypothetical protein ymoll0001_23240 [Yersinia mollaretii ATCC 43969]